MLSLTRLLLSVVFLSFVFAGCEGGYSWQVDPTPYSYPQTNVDQFRTSGGFYFPAGTHVYDIVTCLNIRSGTTFSITKDNIDPSSDFFAFHYSRTPDHNTDKYIKETITLTNTSGENSTYTFAFDSEKGFLQDETLETGIELSQNTGVWCFRII